MSYGLKQPNLTNMTAAEYLMSMSPRSYRSGSIDPDTGVRGYYGGGGVDGTGGDYGDGSGGGFGGDNAGGYGPSSSMGLSPEQVAEREQQIARSFEEHKAEVQKAEAAATAAPPGRSFGFFNALSSGIETLLGGLVPGFDPDFDGKSMLSQEVREPGLYFGLPVVGQYGPQVGATGEGLSLSPGTIADYLSDPDTNVADDLGDLAGDLVANVSDFNVSDFTDRFNPGLAPEPGERLAASRPQVSTPVADLARKFSQVYRPVSIF